MIGPAGTFAAPRASDYKPWQLRIYLKTGGLYAIRRFATEEEARGEAIAWGEVRGQKGWTEEVRYEGSLVAVYRGGREVRRKKKP